MDSHHLVVELGQEFRASHVEMNASWRTLFSNILLCRILEILRSHYSIQVSVTVFMFLFFRQKQRAFQAGRQRCWEDEGSVGLPHSMFGSTHVAGSCIPSRIPPTHNSLFPS